jgi:hypothetical protein
MQVLLSFFLLLSLHAINFDDEFSAILEKNAHLIENFWNVEEKDGFFYQINGQFKKRSEILEYLNFHIKESSTKNHVFYPFGGPDFFYPDLCFPNMKILCLIGLESIGECLNKDTLNKISESKYFSSITYLLQDLPFKSYFVTSKMHRVYELSIGALLATQIKLLGYHLEQIDHIDKPYACIRLSYKKNQTDGLREIRYYNFNLLKHPLAILEYLFKAHQFDAGFM